MGLDMGLVKKTYLTKELKDRIRIIGKPVIDIDKALEISESFGYWRKANHIHSWFVNNIQDGYDDCKEYEIDKSDLKKLLDVVNNVINDHSLAEELLPTASGFFFGNTDYDEYYFKSLEYTKDILEKALACEDSDFYYHSSW
jgi:hypothetical protein